MSAESITSTRREHYLHPPRALPLPAESITPTRREHYPNPPRALPLAAESITSTRREHYLYPPRASLVPARGMTAGSESAGGTPPGATSRYPHWPTHHFPTKAPKISGTFVGKRSLSRVGHRLPTNSRDESGAYTGARALARPDSPSRPRLVKTNAPLSNPMIQAADSALVLGAEGGAPSPARSRRLAPCWMARSLASSHSRAPPLPVPGRAKSLLP